MELQEQLEIGRQAEEFLKYIDERPYFKNLIERVKLSLAQWILSLSSEDQDKFSILKTRMDMLDDVLNFARDDILIAQGALKKLNGEKEKGIL